MISGKLCRSGYWFFGRMHLDTVIVKLVIAANDNLADDRSFIFSKYSVELLDLLIQALGRPSGGYKDQCDSEYSLYKFTPGHR